MPCVIALDNVPCFLRCHSLLGTVFFSHTETSVIVFFVETMDRGSEFLKLQEDLMPFSTPLIDQRCTDMDTLDENSCYLLESKLICRRLPVLESVMDMEREMAKDLRMLIFESNMHDEKHNIFSCTKGRAGKRFKCRFGFPHPLVPVTYIHADGRIRMKRNDPWVNKWNRYILSAIRCNHDIRLLCSGPDAKSCIIYASDYCVKPSIKTSNLATIYALGVQRVELLERSGVPLTTIERARQMLIRCLNQLGGAQERSGQEVAQQLLGLPNAYKSHRFTYVRFNQFLRFVDHTLKPDEQPDKSESKEAQQPAHEMEDLLCTLAEEGDDYYSDDEEDGADDSPRGGGGDVVFSRNRSGQTSAHTQREDYVHRPRTLKDCSMYLFFATFKKIRITAKVPKTALYFDEGHRNRDTHALVPRQKVRVPVFLGPRIPNPARGVEFADRSAFLKLVQFKPFRRGSDLKELDQTWIDALRDYVSIASPQVRRCLKNIDALHEGQSQRDKERKEQENNLQDESYRYRDGWLGDAEFHDGTNDFPELLYDTSIPSDQSPESLGIDREFLETVSLTVNATSGGYEQTYADEAFMAAQVAGFTQAPVSDADEAPMLSVDSSNPLCPKLHLPSGSIGVDQSSSSSNQKLGFDSSDQKLGSDAGMSQCLSQWKQTLEDRAAKVPCLALLFLFSTCVCRKPNSSRRRWMRLPLWDPMFSLRKTRRS